MGTVSRKLGDGAKSESWHVRNERGETFGPVDLATLKLWACDGRLAPTNELSTDGAEWKIVTSLRSLEMDWVSEVTPGTFYGPIHRSAMDELIKDGSIAAQSELFVRSGVAESAGAPSGETPLTAKVKSLTDELEQLRQRIASDDERLLQAREQSAALQTQVEQTRLQLEAQEDQARKQAAAYLAQTEQAQRQTTEAQALLRVAEQQLAAQAEQMRRQVSAYEEQVRLAQQQAAAYVTQVEQAQQQAAAYAAQLEQAQQLAADAETRFLAATDRAASCAVQVERLQQQVSQAEANLRTVTEQAQEAQRQSTSNAAQVEKLQRQVSKAEADLRAATELASEHARQAQVAQQQWAAQTQRQADELAAVQKERTEAVAEAARALAARDARVLFLDDQIRSLEAELQELRAALSRAQAETAAQCARLAEFEAALSVTKKANVEQGDQEAKIQALSAELVALRCAQAGELSALQKERTEAAAESARLLATRDARVLFLEEQLAAREAERQELSAALSRVQAEMAAREVKWTEFEAALSGAKKANIEQGDQDAKIQTLSAEIVGFRRALDAEKDAVQQAQLRCEALEKSLDDVRSQRQSETSLEKLAAELEKMRLQVDDLKALFLGVQAARGTGRAETSADPVRVQAEPVEVEVLPPEKKSGPHAHQQTAEAEHAHAERSRRSVEATLSGAGRSSSGLSLADLEQQARRELERLGAQGANLFKKKR